MNAAEKLSILNTLSKDFRSLQRRVGAIFFIAYTHFMKNSDPISFPDSPGRPLRKRAMHAIRRGHLYLGLFLFPWAVLYGVTSFLFNHPTAFSDSPTTAFEADTLAGTPFEVRTGAREVAEQVLAKLNEKQKPASPYALAGEPRFTREFAFATVKAEGQTVSVLVDVKSGSGTVRSQVVKEKVEPEKPPFAPGRGEMPGGRGGQPRGEGGPRGSGAADAIKLENPIHERIKASVPTILERTGFPTGDVTVTSVPDIQFPILADGRTWTATYNPMTGAIGGTLAEAKSETEISVRRFLLRLHTAHGYPGEPNARWFWAVIVDVMAFVMCFWVVSGLLMWWQLKATRKLGLAILVLSAIAATALGFAMHGAMTGG